MNEPENFLARWSRRKREAEQEKDQPAAPANTESAPALEQQSLEDEFADVVRSRISDEQDKKDDSDSGKLHSFDLTKLPPIESITATTDIRPFLSAGVPEDLKYAALRRAWVVDPTIRDFVGIAENQWDFTATDGVPGFGPLLPVDDVRRLVAEVLGDRGEVTSPEATADAPMSAPQPVAVTEESAPPSERDDDVMSPREAATSHDPAMLDTVARHSESEPNIIVQNESTDGALQNNEQGHPQQTTLERRVRGTALPN